MVQLLLPTRQLHPNSVPLTDALPRCPHSSGCREGMKSTDTYCFWKTKSYVSLLFDPGLLNASWRLVPWPSTRGRTATGVSRQPCPCSLAHPGGLPWSFSDRWPLCELGGFHDEITVISGRWQCNLQNTMSLFEGFVMKLSPTNWHKLQMWVTSGCKCVPFPVHHIGCF